jgi:hypothetical protein
MPSINDVWKRNAAAGTGEPITLPSGQACIARKIGVEGLIELGLLTEIDAFTSIVDVEAIQPAKTRLQGKNPKKPTLKERAAAKDREDAETNNKIMSAITSNPDSIKTIAAMLNKLVPAIVIEPRVLCHTIDGAVIPADERDEDAVYTDQIDFMDKMELFTWSIGDMGDLAPFRPEAGGSVDGVADVADVPVPAVGHPGDN